MGVLLSCNNFLEVAVNPESKDLVIMNPPWVKIGTEFINKAAMGLRVNGRMVCIISNTQFAAASKNKKGTFYDLQQKGSFYRIETFKGNTKRDHFNGKGDWVWFIWDKNKENKSTQIVNRLGNEFTYTLQGNELYIPQLKNESDYFDWNKGLKVFAVTGPNKNAPKDRIFFKILKNKNIFIHCPSGSSPGACMASIDDNQGVTQETLTNMFKKEKFYDLYAQSQGMDTLRLPPLIIGEVRHS